jgi:transcriptional regulator with XRE-family HTH domain
MRPRRKAKHRAAAAFDASLRVARRCLAANIATLRRARGSTQRELGDLAALDLKHLQKLEYASANPTLDTLVRIAAGFGVHVRDLIAPTKARPRRRRVGRPRAVRARTVPAREEE